MVKYKQIFLVFLISEIQSKYSKMLVTKNNHGSFDGNYPL
jgi:hypothetical protein